MRKACVFACLVGGLVSWHAPCHAGEAGNQRTLEWLSEVGDWRRGLRVGANGPIPHIVVDQFGYRTKARKVAVIRDPREGYDKDASFTPGGTYALVDAKSRKILKLGAPVSWKQGAVDKNSGDRAWWFDFSEVEEPGRYTVVDVERRLRSPDFTIGPDVYAGVLKTAVRTFYFQRAGFEKVKSLADAWADKASHVGPGQDGEARPWPGTLAATQGSKYTGVRDLRGGWYDAGDYNKYSSWTARVIINLLKAYAEHPEAFDDATRIPESGNGIPDILDEVKWGLQWLVRMQNEDGSILCVQGLGRGSPPSAARDPSYYGPPTTSATAMASAAFAYAAKIFAARKEEDLRSFAQDLAARAKKAWTWASENPSVFFFNNDDSKQSGSKGLAAGQQEMDDASRALAFFWAALNLFELTNEPDYRNYLDANYAKLVPPYGVNQWAGDALELLMQYAQYDHVPATLKQAFFNGFKLGILNMPFQLEAVRSERDPYLSPMKDYTWGSNQSKMHQARLFQFFAKVAPESDDAKYALQAAEGYIHYIHGVNPLGLVYLSNMSHLGASHSVTTIFHDWFFAGTKFEKVGEGSIGPAPGYLVGGPHASFKIDPCCSAPKSLLGNRCGSAANERICSRSLEPPLKQPTLKSYLQFNADWPGNSWEISEPSIGYQVNYILVLAAYAR